MLTVILHLCRRTNTENIHCICRAQATCTEAQRKKELTDSQRERIRVQRTAALQRRAAKWQPWALGIQQGNVQAQQAPTVDPSTAAEKRALHTLAKALAAPFILPVAPHIATGATRRSRFRIPKDR